MELEVESIVRLKKPIEWLGENAWRVREPPTEGKVLLQHRDSRVHRAYFRLDEIDGAPDSAGNAQT